MSKIRNVIIIGSGPAGYTAAIYSARALLEPLMIAGTMYGGQLMTTTDVENFPGYPTGIDGPKMMTELHEQAERFGTEFVVEDVLKIDTSSKPYKVITKTEEYLTKTIIIATGAKAIWLDALNEEKFKSRGVSTCATCDGAFYKDEKLIVVGGGDSAMEEAIFLTRFAEEVTIVHRRDTFRASKIMLDRAKSNPKIKWMTNKKVVQWLGDDKVSGVCLQDTENGLEDYLSIGGAFIAIGHKPCTGFLGEEIEKTTSGYIFLKEYTMTSVDGIFACGDVCDTRYKQAITAAGSGCKAAMDCEKWLEEQ